MRDYSFGLLRAAKFCRYLLTRLKINCEWISIYIYISGVLVLCQSVGVVGHSNTGTISLAVNIEVLKLLICILIYFCLHWHLAG